MTFAKGSPNMHMCTSTTAIQDQQKASRLACKYKIDRPVKSPAHAGLGSTGYSGIEYADRAHNLKISPNKYCMKSNQSKVSLNLTQ
jgi:hypothetical protein